MGKIIRHKQYVKANLRLEELLDLVDDNAPLENPLTKEFPEVGNSIERYEEVHYPIGLPSLREVINTN